MTRRISLSLVPLGVFVLLSVALVFPCCCPPAGTAPPPNPAGAFVASAAGALVDSFFGGPVSQLPVKNADPCKPDYTPPAYEEDAYKSGGTGACAPATGDDACALCAKHACCSQMGGCFKEDACICRVACRTAHCPTDKADRCATIGALDAYPALDACLSQNCAAQCPVLP